MSKVKSKKKKKVIEENKSLEKKSGSILQQLASNSPTRDVLDIWADVPSSSSLDLQTTTSSAKFSYLYTTQPA